VLITVMLAAVSSAVAFALARATVTESQVVSARLSTGSSQRDALSLLGQVESELNTDPSGVVSRVLQDERSRVCSASGTTVVRAAGTTIPTSCSSWTYTDSSAQGFSRYEVVPPGPTDAALTVKVLTRKGELDAGYEARYVLAGGGRWVWASTGALDASNVASPDGVSISGSAYSLGGVTWGPSLSVASKSVVASESGFSGVFSGSGVSLFGPGQNDVRRVQGGVLRSGDLKASVAAVEKAGCRGTGMIVENSYSSSLCIKQGSTLVTTSGSSVVVPENTLSYMLVFKAASIEIYTKTARADLSEGGELTCTSCDLPGFAGTLSAANKHPGKSTYWTSDGGTLVGEFYYPRNGALVFDGDVYVGVCSSAADEYANGLGCQANGDATEAGTLVQKNLTVVGNNVVVNAPIEAKGAFQLGLAARNNVVLPYWIRPKGSVTNVNAHLLGAGTGTGASVRALPSSLSYAGSGDRNWGTTLRLRGSVAGVNLSNGFTGWRSSELEARTTLDGGASPWFGGIDPTWVRVSLKRWSGYESCGARTCGTITVPVVTIPPPGTPTELSCSSASSSLACSWVVGSLASSGPTTGFTLVVGGVDSWSGTAQSATVSSLTPNTDYVVSVRASGPGGNKSSAGSTRTTLATAPALGSATSITYSSATLAWPLPSGTGTVSSYLLSYSSDSGTTWTTDTVTSPTRSWTGSGLSAGTTYTARLAVVNAGGQGAWGTTTTFTTSNIAPPSTPVCSADSYTTTSLRLTWTAPFNGNSAITQYEVAISATGAGAWTTNTTNALNYTFSGTSGSGYDIRVRATNAIGSSPWCTLTNRVIRPGPVTATLVTQTSSSITISWTAANGASSYDVYRRLGSSYTLVSSGSSATTFQNTGMTDCTSGYQYVVYAAGYWGYTTASNTLSAGTSCSLPGAPTISSVTAGHLSLSVAFSAPAANGSNTVTNYEYSTNNGSTWTTRSPSSTSSPISITGLTNGVAYQVKIRAVNNMGSGTASNTMSGTPQWSAMTASCTGCSSTTVVSGGRTYQQYTFTSSGSMTITSAGSDASVDYLVVGGGGGGATHGGNGGAGGSGGQTRHGSVAVGAGAYSATVGQGGSGVNTINVPGTTGGSSVFGSITASGGCSGISYGCGMYYDVSFNGGSTYRAGGSWVFYGGGGGAGAGGDGANAPGNETGGAGGVGLSLWGSIYSGGGGGGGGAQGQTASGGSSGGAGRGFLAGGAGSSAPANTGSGGGGGYSSAGNGGSGIVIVRYAITAP